MRAVLDSFYRQDHDDPQTFDMAAFAAAVERHERRSGDSLEGVRFFVDGKSLEIGGIECGIHGYRGPDCCRGSTSWFERLGIDVVLGHFHQPRVRAAVSVDGVCQPNLGYSHRPSTKGIAQPPGRYAPARLPT